MKLKDILKEEISYYEYKSLKNNLVKSAIDLANYYDRIAKMAQKNKNNQDEKYIKSLFRTAEKYREIIKFTNKGIPSDINNE